MGITVPSVQLNNGKKMPIFGLGTWKSKPGEVTEAVKDAIDVGYRHIDCAYIYGNEKEVGAGIAAKIQEGVVKREDLFIVSKLWNTFHRPDLVEPSFRETLTNLGLDYLDLYLMHSPIGFKEDGELFPKDDQGNTMFSDVDYLDTWKSMEKLVEKGLVHSVGVSNFNSEQVDRLMEHAKIKPVNNQVECHPYLNQSKLMEHCAKRGVTLTAYSPLGSPDKPAAMAKPDEPKLLEDSKIKSIAEKYGKTPAQIILRYQVQRGFITIPKSVTKKRIIENIEIFNFELTKDDVAQIDLFDCNGRMFIRTDCVKHKYYPFNIPY